MLVSARSELAECEDLGWLCPRAGSSRARVAYCTKVTKVAYVTAEKTEVQWEVQIGRFMLESSVGPPNEIMQ
jgi:hypothetical protein